MSKTAVPKTKKTLDPAVVIARGAKSILTALGPDATVILAVVDGGYDLHVRLGTADAVAAEILNLLACGKDSLVLAGAKPRRRSERLPEHSGASPHRRTSKPEQKT